VRVESFRSFAPDFNDTYGKHVTSLAEITEIEKRIVQQASDLFMRYGVRNVTMDDIVRELGISKKTLYQYFPDKAELVLRVSAEFFHLEESAFCAIEAQAENAIHELVLIMQWMGQMFSKMSPNLIFEIHRYYPTAWALFDTHRCEHSLIKIITNLKRGVEEGVFRADINIDLVARLRVGAFSQPHDAKLFPADKYSFLAVQQESFLLFVHSIVTPKGLALFHQYSHTAQSSPKNSPSNV